MNILLRDGDVLEVPPFDDIYASDMVGVSWGGNGVREMYHSRHAGVRGGR